MFCHNCGEEFKPYTDDHGEMVTMLCRFCHVEKWNMKLSRGSVGVSYCIICGAFAPSSYHRYCTTHRPWGNKDPRKILANEAATRSKKLNILYQCECGEEKGKKEKHHPDYDFPLSVALLCRTCHAAEHKRLRSLATANTAVNQ